MYELARLRQALGLSQRACAARIGTTQASLQSWEKGMSTPNSITAERYAEVLGITISHLNDLLIKAQNERASAEAAL